MKTLAPGPATAVEILRSKGFTVEWRINANGSPRIRVNGSREMSAADLSRRFAAYL